MTTRTHIRILLATFNGAAHLREQLDSIANQQKVDWSLVIADDGSTDDTMKIARAFADEQPRGKVTIGDGPRRGSSANFLAMLAQVQPDECDFVAFCDQDDVWMQDKLWRATQTLLNSGGDEPALYASAQIITDGQLANRRLSRTCPLGPSFSNALVQNIMSGNSQVMNTNAVKLVQRSVKADAEIPAHDWWVYLVVSGAGGQCHFDQKPGLFYRQHSGNLLGGNRGLGAIWRRLGMIWARTLRDWVSDNLTALANAGVLTQDNSQIVARLRDARSKGGRSTLSALRTLGLRRQRRLETYVLYLSALLGRY